MSLGVHYILHFFVIEKRGSWLLVWENKFWNSTRASNHTKWYHLRQERFGRTLAGMVISNLLSVSVYCNYYGFYLII